MVKFEYREIWADLENRSKVVHSENFPIWRPASGHRDHVTHHVTSHVTHWGQWKYASRSWHAVGNHRRQLKLMYRSKILGRGPKHCSGSKFQCRPRPANGWVLLDAISVIAHISAWVRFRSPDQVSAGILFQHLGPHSQQGLWLHWKGTEEGCSLGAWPVWVH